MPSDRRPRNFEEASSVSQMSCADLLHPNTQQPLRTLRAPLT